MAPDETVPDETVPDWNLVMTAGSALGWPPCTILAATLPELLIAVAGWRQANGLELPSARGGAMTRSQLTELIQRCENNDK